MPDSVKTALPLTTARILNEAMRLADEGGIEAVSLRRLGALMGVTPMALYHHVHDKDALLEMMADRLVSEIEALDEPPGSSWQEALRSVGERYLAVISAHAAAPFLLSRPFDSRAARQLSGRILGILALAGFAPEDAVPLLQVSTGMLLGPAIHRATYAAAVRRRSVSSSRTSIGGHPSESAWASEAAEGTQPGWIWGPDADRLTLELWLAAVEGRAERRSKT